MAIFKVLALYLFDNAQNKMSIGIRILQVLHYKLFWEL